MQTPAYARPPVNPTQCDAHFWTSRAQQRRQDLDNVRAKMPLSSSQRAQKTATSCQERAWPATRQSFEFEEVAFQEARWLPRGQWRGITEGAVKRHWTKAHK